MNFEAFSSGNEFKIKPDYSTMEKQLEDQLSAIETIINYKFKNQKILKEAFTHSSYTFSTRQPRTESNERLEFIGDSILNHIISIYLFDTSDGSESSLSLKRTEYISRPLLDFCCKKMKLNNYLLLGKGELDNGGKDKPSICENLIEAIIGAIYIDGGEDKAFDFVYDFILDAHDEFTAVVNYKSKLQHYAQTNKQADVVYKLISVIGEAHRKTFSVQATISGEVYGEGHASNKKQAEQNAAKNALENLSIE